MSKCNTHTRFLSGKLSTNASRAVTGQRLAHYRHPFHPTKNNSNTGQTTPKTRYSSTPHRRPTRTWHLFRVHRPSRSVSGVEKRSANRNGQTERARPSMTVASTEERPFRQFPDPANQAASNDITQRACNDLLGFEFNGNDFDRRTQKKLEFGQPL